MAQSPKELALELLAALSSKDLARADAVLADDAILYDPHYPQPLMVGKDAINGNLGWVFGFLKSMSWTVVHAWEDADSAVLQVETRHEMPDGTPITPPQVFVANVKDGKIARWTTYVPYPPPAPPAQ